MAITRQKKATIIEALMNDWKKAKSVIFSTYQGIPVKELSQLRKQLREKGAQLRVAKKTLIRLAAKRLNFPAISEETLPGAISLTFGFDDEITAARVIQAFAKTHPQVSIVAGFMEGRVLSEKEAKFLATIPERNELYARLVWSLMSPISGFHAVLSGLLRNFVHVVSEIHKKKVLASGALGPEANQAMSSLAP